MPRFRYRSGQTLIEVIIAIGLLAIFASTLFVYIGSQLVTSQNTAQSVQAVSLAHEGLEAARAIRDSGWSALAAGPHGLAFSSSAWSFQNTSDTTDGYSRTVTVTDLSSTERQVVSTVSWRMPSGIARSVSLATNLTDWRHASQPPLLSGNWGNPQTLGTIDLGPGNQATGVAVKSKIVYMSGLAASSGKPDFYVIDATDGLHPTLITSLNIGPGSNDLALSDHYAYVVDDHDDNQLHIVDVSVTSTPVNIKTFTIPDNGQNALTVAATGTLVLVGTKQSTHDEFYIIDVADPAAPFVRGSLEVSGDVNRIVISGNRAYLATANSAQEFLVVNIANPNVPAFTARVDLPGSNAATGLYYNSQDHRVYVTRAQGSGTSPEITLYDATNADAPIFLGSQEFGGDIPAVFAADDLMFLGTSVSNLEFQIFRSTNPSNLAYYSGLNFPQVANDIAFEDNVIYVAVRSNDALRIITSQ